MGDNISSQKVVTTYTLRGRIFNVTMTLWTNHPGASYDISDAETHFALHNESFDDLPSEQDVSDLIAELESNGVGHDPTFFDEGELAAFLDSLSEETEPQPDDEPIADVLISVTPQMISDLIGGETVIESQQNELGHPDAMGVLSYALTLVPNVDVETYDDRPAIVISRGQLSEWAGRSLSDHEISHIAEHWPNSSISEAFANIADALPQTEGD